MGFNDYKQFYRNVLGDFLEFGDINNCCSFVGNSSTESENNNTGFISDYIPTTNFGKISFKVEEILPEGVYVNGYVILNQCGSLLTHYNHKMKGCIK